VGHSCQNFRWTLSQSLQLNLRLGGYSIWSAILQSHFYISFGFKTTRALLKTFKGSTRGRLGLLEKTSRLLKHQLEYISASGCFNYSCGLLTCSTQGRLRTTRYRLSRLLEAILLDYKVLGGLSYGPPWAHCLGGYQDRLLGGPLGLLDLHCTAPDGVKHKDYRGEVLG
jgi:hypothetical protein